MSPASVTITPLRGTLITMSTQPFERREIETRMRVLRDAYIYGEPVAGAPFWVRTWPDLRLLARAHGLPTRSVVQRAKDHRWVEERAKAKVQVEVAGERARAEQRLRASALVETDALISAEKGMHLVRDRLESMEISAADWCEQRDRLRAAVAAGDTEEIERLNGEQGNWVPYHPVDVRDLKGLADAGRGYVEMLQTTLGTSTMNVVVTGPGGGPVQVDHIHQTLNRDDPDRLYALIEAINRAQIASVVEGEVVEEEDDVEEDEVE